MLALKLGLRSVVRRGWSLLLIILPAALLFAMVTFLIATETTVQQLLEPGIAARAFRIGTVEGMASWELQSFSEAEVNQLGTTPGVVMAPAFFVPCGLDATVPDELTCGIVTRAYIQIWSMDMFVPEEELDRWDKVKNGVIVTRAAAAKHNWKVGDRVDIQLSQYPMELVITYIADKYIDPTTIYSHISYYQQRYAGVKVLRYWVVWVLVDKPEERKAIMEEMDAKLERSHRVHTLWTLELTKAAILSGSRVLRQSFLVAGVFSFLLVTCLAVAMLVLSIEQRIVELAALAAIGFRRGVLMRSVLVEGILLLPPAAILGAMALWIPFHANPLAFDSIFRVKVTLMNAAEGVGCGVLVGLVAAIIPAWRVYRLDVLGSLR